MSSNKPSANSIHRNLLSRIAAITVLLVVFGGGTSYLYERGQVTQRISEQAALGTLVLRARVDAKLVERGGSWQDIVQETLDELAEQAPLAASGRFAALVVNDAVGIEVGNLARDSTADWMDALPALPDEGAFGEPGVRLGRVLDEGKLPLVPVLISVAGADGSVVAYIRGIYEVSEETVSKLRRRAVFSSLAPALAVVATTLVIFPVVRRLTGRLTALSAELLDANLQSLRVLGSAIAKRDSDTDAHNYRVTLYSVRLAERVKLDDAAIRALIKGAFLHDVGKIGTPDRVLLKPGRLDNEEFTEMKRHVEHGLDIVRESSWLKDAAPVVGYHHEKFDGSGYHARLRGAEIPISARIFSIADVFDALTSERPYKQPFSLDRSLQMMREDAGHHFDPALLIAFEEIAESLYRRFAEESASVRSELSGVLDKYFSQDLDAVLKDSHC